MAKKEHLLSENFYKIMGLRANLNLGIPKLLKKALNITKNSYISHSGITDKIWLTFQITQHSRDTLFMKTIIKYLNCGRRRNRSFTPAVDFLVNRSTDIDKKVISFLDKYPLHSVKQKDFKDF